MGFSSTVKTKARIELYREFSASSVFTGSRSPQSHERRCMELPVDYCPHHEWYVRLNKRAKKNSKRAVVFNIITV